MTKELNYEKDVTIDESALDVEWLEQPRLMARYCQHAAECKKELDHAKEALEVKKAELDKDIRSTPDLYDIGKITETVVQNTITTQTDYQQAMTEFIQAKYEYEMAQAAVRSIDQKKTALENLVKLHGMSYFAGPSVPRDLSKEWEQKEKQKEANTRVKATRRKK